MSAETRMVCAACGQRIDPRSQAPYRCPRAGDDRDHLLGVQLSAEVSFDHAAQEAQPFARYATMLYAFHAARAAGWPAARYAEAVRRLDEQLEEVAGVGLRCTTPQRNAALSDALGCSAEGGVWVQNESSQPSGSHKARHLFGVALWIEIADALKLAGGGEPLAVASCGNAARAAAAIALAAGRELVVFVPDWASADTLAELRRLDADVVVCTRESGDPPGDPCVHRFHEALEDGALPFSCQGTENGLVVEGSRTIAWDAVVAEPNGFDRVQLQVGGGAFAAGFAQGAEFAVERGAWPRLPRIHAVQSAAVAPLAPAWAALAKWTAEGGLDAAVTRARGRRAAAMRPVEHPGTSVADGILDDETYDWLELARIGIASDGAAQVVSEDLLREAHQLGRDATGIDVCATGTAGLAGLLLDHQAGKLDPAERSLVVFTGAQR
jgi:threonine synthase